MVATLDSTGARREIIRLLAESAVAAVAFGLVSPRVPRILLYLAGEGRSPAAAVRALNASLDIYVAFWWVLAFALAVRSRLPAVLLLLVCPFAILVAHWSWSLWGRAFTGVDSIDSSLSNFRQAVAFAVPAALVSVAIVAFVVLLRAIRNGMRRQTAGPTHAVALVELQIPFVDHVIDIGGVAIVIIGLGIPLGAWAYIVAVNLPRLVG